MKIGTVRWEDIALVVSLDLVQGWPLFGIHAKRELFEFKNVIKSVAMTEDNNLLQLQDDELKVRATFCKSLSVERRSINLCQCSFAVRLHAALNDLS